MFFKHEICENIQKPNPILEPFILKSPKHSYLYAKQVLKKRWKKAEKIILDTSFCNPEYAYLYAKNVLKKRWTSAENSITSILKDETGIGYHWEQKARDAAALYAIHVVKGRWKRVESYIINSPNVVDYISVLEDEEVKEFTNLMVIEGMQDSKFAKQYFRWKPTHKIKRNGSRAVEVMLDSAGCNRFGWKGDKRHDPDHYGWVRAFTLKEWMRQVSDLDAGKSVYFEYCAANDSWYYKRQVAYYNKPDYEKYRLHGAVVTPAG